MKEISISVNKSEVLVSGSLTAIQYEHNSTKINFQFDSSWDGLNKTVTFVNSNGIDPVVVPLDEIAPYSAVVPHEATEYPGDACFIIDGFTSSQEGEITLVLRTHPIQIKVFPALKRGTKESAFISETDYERLLSLIGSEAEERKADIALINEYKTDAENASSLAQSAKDDASAARDEAQESAAEASGKAIDAAAAYTGAVAAKESAKASAIDAESASNTARESADIAVSAGADAEIAKNEAAAAYTGAVAAKESAKSSASAAEIAKNEAESAYSNIISVLDDYDIPGFMENVLEKDNAEEYTPSGDFNPATKKYVDEANADTLESSKSYTDAAATAEAAAREITDAELERLEYYGDKDIVPTDESYFTVNDTGETITGLTDTGKANIGAEVVIPYKINGVKITGTFYNEDFDEDGYWTSIFYEATTSPTKVILPNSVMSIGPATFRNCTSLKSINIPNSVTSIGDEAFSGCTSLKSINIPDSVTSIGNSAFGSCYSLTSIVIPGSVTNKIDSAAFQDCTSLTSVIIGNGVTCIGDGIFYSCESLSSIYIPNSVTAISPPDFAFCGCENLTIYCEEGSYAESYAKRYSIPIIYTDVKAETINAKADAADVYTKDELYTKTEVDTALEVEAAARSEKDTELEGEIDTLKSKSIPHTTVSGYPLTVNDHLEGETVINYQVYGNSVQDGTPTPETPIEIQSVGDLVTDTSSEYYGKYDVPVTVRGKNLFDYSRQFATPIIQGGLTIQYLEDEQCFLINGTSAATESTYIFGYSNFKIIPNAYYSVSARYVSGSIDKTNCTTEKKWSLVYFGKSDIPNKTTNWLGHELANTDTVSENKLNNCNYISRVWFYINPGIVFDNYKVKIQVELGSTATSYEPYRGETKHIYLDEPLRMVGDCADYVDFKNQKAVRQVEVLDSTGTKTIDESLGILSTPTKEDITVPYLSVPNSESVNIFAGTTISPSSIDLTYYQDINKVITNLTNAILAQGGNV